MIYTIDKNYNAQEYTRITENLKKNGVSFNEFIHFRTYEFFLETEEKPVFLDYEESNNLEKKFLLAKVKPLNEQDEYLLQRRNLAGRSALKLAYNDAYNYFKDKYIYFFNIRDKQNLLTLSRNIGRIYYFGKYYSMKYRVALTDNPNIQNFVGYENVLAEGKILQAELNLNYNIFKNQDYLKKYTQTLYAEDGKVVRPKISSELNII